MAVAKKPVSTGKKVVGGGVRERVSEINGGKMYMYVYFLFLPGFPC
jgi:hypothetical protein